MAQREPRPESGFRRYIDASPVACGALMVVIALTCAGSITFAFLAPTELRRLLATPIPLPTPTLSPATPGTNLALRKVVHVSSALPDFPASYAVDGNPRSWWGSGAHPPGWIEVDLGANYAVSQIRLLPSQSPPGETVHRLAVKGTVTGDEYAVLTVFRGPTRDAVWLTYEAPEPLRGVRYLRIETSSSPSWVGWREIEVLAGE